MNPGPAVGATLCAAPLLSAAAAQVQSAQNNEPIDIHALEAAVKVFYESGSSQQAVAHEWLTRAQCSTQAWSFVWELMQPTKTTEIQFFGATTLHCKLVKNWSEVPLENYEELKQKLLDTIILFGPGPKIVLNRLCISLSAFIVQMIDDWPTAIEDVTNTFQKENLPNVPAVAHTWIMMEVLCGIPEESNSVATSVHRHSLRAKINKKAPFVMRIIEQYLSKMCEQPALNENDSATLLRASKCIKSWLKNDGFPLDTCQYLASCLLKLINMCYWNGTQKDGCMSADDNELTESCLDTLTSMMIQPDAHRYTNTALQLIRMFLDTLSPITKAEFVEDNANEDIAVCIYSLFITSCESHSRILLSGVLAESAEHQELYQRLIQEIMQCTDKPGIFPVEESSSTLAMGFWYMLQDEILSMDADADREKCTRMIMPVYMHLAKILVRKSQMPDEEALETWSSDDLEQFRCYRQDISDTLMYCYEVLRESLLDCLMQLLNESICIIRNDPKQWTQLEASIHAFCAVAEQIDTGEGKCIPQLVKVLSEIPYSTLNEKILGTALETIGAYCEWFKDSPEYLPPVIELLVQGLNSSQASQATLGLKDICRECQAQLKPFAQPLLQACQQTLMGGRLLNSESVRLMFSIGKLMSMLPEEQLMPCLDSMVSPCFEELQSILNAQLINEASSLRTLFRLQMISTVFQSLNTKTDSESTRDQPVLFVLQKTMVIFKNVASLFIEQSVITEALCNALKHAITNLMNDIRPMLNELCCLIVSILQTKCVPAAIEISKTCVILFHKDEQCIDSMRQLHLEVILYNLRMFEQTSLLNLSDIAENLESFYAFNSQIVKRIPALYANASVDCIKLLAYANRTLILPETGPVKNAVWFIAHFIGQAHTSEHMTAALLNQGMDILKTVLHCVGILTPRSHADIFADIFLTLNKRFPSELVAWFKLLEIVDYPSPLISNAEKENFMKSIIREKSNKRLVQCFLRDFAAKCRGLPDKL